MEEEETKTRGTKTMSKSSSHIHAWRILAASVGLAVVVSGVEFALGRFDTRQIPSGCGLSPFFHSARLFLSTSGTFFAFLTLLRTRHPKFAAFLDPVRIESVEQEPTAAETFVVASRKLLASVPKLTELLRGQLDETNRIGGESALAVLNQISGVQGEASRLLSTLTEVRAEAAAMCGNAQTLIQSSREKLEEMGTYTRLREEEIRDDSQAIERIVTLTKDLAPLTGEIGTLSRQTRLIALNAAIQAANDQSIGRGFVTVADEMRRLAVQIGSASGQVDEIMRQVAATVEEKLSDMVSFRRIETERNWLHVLTDSMTRMSGDFESAVFGQDRLSKECHAAVQSIFAAVLKTQELSQFQDISRQQIEQVQRGLALFGERLGDASRALSTGSDEGIGSLDSILETLEGTYAMRTQRSVHARVVLDKIDDSPEARPMIELF
jgi:methyl-accepting chemotaxis protein